MTINNRGYTNPLTPIARRPLARPEPVPANSREPAADSNDPFAREAAQLLAPDGLDAIAPRAEPADDRGDAHGAAAVEQPLPGDRSATAHETYMKQQALIREGDRVHRPHALQQLHMLQQLQRFEQLQQVQQVHAMQPAAEQHFPRAGSETALLQARQLQLRLLESLQPAQLQPAPNEAPPRHPQAPLAAPVLRPVAVRPGELPLLFDTRGRAGDSRVVGGIAIGKFRAEFREPAWTVMKTLADARRADGVGWKYGYELNLDVKAMLAVKTTLRTKFPHLPDKLLIAEGIRRDRRYRINPAALQEGPPVDIVKVTGQAVRDYLLRIASKDGPYIAWKDILTHIRDRDDKPATVCDANYEIVRKAVSAQRGGGLFEPGTTATGAHGYRAKFPRPGAASAGPSHAGHKRKHDDDPPVPPGAGAGAGAGAGGEGGG